MRIFIVQVVTYFFYKNLTFTLTQFWFTFQTGFSGQRFYDDWFQSLYNVIFTALPVIIVGLFDKVVPSFRLLMTTIFYCTYIEANAIGLLHQFSWEKHLSESPISKYNILVALSVFIIF